MPRRPSMLLVSIAVHAIVLIVIASADLWKPITDWPTPRRALAFLEETPRVVRLDDIPLPPQSRRTNTSRALDDPVRPTEGAPIVAPPEVAPEVRRQDLPGIPGDPGPLDKLIGGPGSVALPQPPIVSTPPSELKPPLRPHSGIKPPQRLVNVAPVYPMAALAARKEGVVIIDATIDEQGNVTQTRILRSIPLLDEAAEAAVRRWKFSPTLLNGVPVPIVMTVTVNFKLAP
jgi:TonB family protein